MSDVANLKDTIVPNSNQLNADQLIGGPMTITVTAVRRGNSEQPIIVHYANEAGRPYKPCLTMRKVLIFAWGEDGEAWVGKSMTLYNKRDVKWGGVEVGGIRISHMSHIEGDIKLSLAVTRGKKDPVIIKRLDVRDPTIAARTALEQASRGGMASLRAAWDGLPAAMKTAIGGCPAELKVKAQEVDAANAPPPVAEIIDTAVTEVQADHVPQPAEVEPTANTDEFF